MTGTGSRSCQSFSPQPFQILAQCFLLLFVFGQWAVRWSKNQNAFPEIFFLPPVGRGNVPRPLSLNDQTLSRMRFTLVASSFLRLNSEAKASAILRRFFRRPARHFGS